VAGVARISQDGSHVYFVARGRLTDEPRGGGCIGEETSSEQAEEETTHEGRCRAKQGHPNLYVYARDGEHPLGHVSFLATLGESEFDELDWSASDIRPVQTTPTGQRLVFVSTAALTPGVTGEGRQVYEYDAHSEELIRISRGQDGYPQGTANANNSFASMAPQFYFEVATPTSGSTFLAITDDGSDVMFSSPAALTESAVEAAEHGAISAYEYRAAARLSDGNVYLLSSGQDTESANPRGFSRSGKDAFFTAFDQLLGQQDTRQKNIFDARLGGGFPAVVPPATCTGEACLVGTAQAAPATTGPASATTSPVGDAPGPAPLASVTSRRVAKAPKLKELQRALNKCRRSIRRDRSRKKCEKHAREQMRRRHRSSKVKRG
jgi:hypothetical protein